MPKLFSSITDAELIRYMQTGAVGVLPTDTVYGLATQAVRAESVKRLYTLKNREHKPGTIIAANIEQLVELGIPRRYVKAVEQFWPGAVSVVIPVGDEAAYLHEGKQSLAVRIPDYPELQNLLAQTGPLMTSSANRPGEPPAGTISQAQDYFGNQPDFYVDGGDLTGAAPSTVLRMVDDAIEVLRQGAVIINEEGYKQ